MSKPIFHVHIADRALFDAQFVTVDPDGKYHTSEAAVIYQGFFRTTLTRNNKTLSLMKISQSDAEKYLRPLVNAGLCSVIGASGTVTIDDDIELPALHTTIRDTADLSEADKLLVKEVWPEGFKPSIDEEGNEHPPTKMWGWLA